MSRHGKGHALNKLLRFDWDIIAGITAAVIAIVLHLLHVVEVDVLFTLILVLLALLLFPGFAKRKSRRTSG